MNMKTRKRILLLFIILCLLSTASCKASNVGDETTEPLDKMINGLLSEDCTLYKSAFPSDYITLLTEELTAVGENIDTLITDIFKGALDAHIVNYGKNTCINYVLISKDAMTQEELNQIYLDYYLVEYNLPVEHITEAYKANFDITVKGDDTSSTRRAVYKLLKIDGVWYIHPESFMNVFSG